MKNKILAIVSELFFAPENEVKVVLQEVFGGLKKSTFEENIAELEEEISVYRLLPAENSESTVGYILSTDDPCEDCEVRKILTEKGFSKRSPSIINWEQFFNRMFNEISHSLESLNEDISSQREEPKKLEMKYFDLAIKYHKLYGFAFENYKTDFLAPLQEKLGDYRKQLNNLEY